MSNVDTDKPTRFWSVQRWRRIASNLSALAVGGTAAKISWTHIVHSAMVYGHQDKGTAIWYPVSIDGMMIVGVVAAVDDRASGRKVRWWARVATWIGGLLSIGAQILSALPYGAVAWVIASIPAGTLIIVVEVLARRGKKIVEKAQAETRVPATVPVSEPVMVPAPTPAPVPSPMPRKTARKKAPAKAEPTRPRPRKEPHTTHTAPLPDAGEPVVRQAIEATVITPTVTENGLAPVFAAGPSET